MRSQTYESRGFLQLIVASLTVRLLSLHEPTVGDHIGISLSE